jgi:ABC-type Fe3+-citrate transport system substrate-binding protein
MNNITFSYYFKCRRLSLIKYSLILILLFNILFVTGCDNTSPTTTTPPVTVVGDIPGETICDSELQKNVVNAITMFESFSNSNCENIAIADTKVTQQQTSENGIWIENWIVDRCGTEIVYTLTFTPSKDGGAAFSVEQAKAQ